MTKTGSGTATIFDGVSFSNPGTIQVQAGTFSVKGSFSNLSGTTLSGGTYFVSGTLLVPGTSSAINTLAASVTLDGTSSQIINENSQNALAGLTSVTSIGSFTVQNGQTFTTTNSAFSNAGAFTVGSGSTFTATQSYTQSGGSTTVNGTLVSTASTLTINGGSLSGTGQVQGNVLNHAGQFNPGGTGVAGAFQIQGNYTQDSGGTFNADLGGTTAGSLYDQLNAAGAVSLSGTLNVNLINGFSPASGNAFQVITGSVGGTFATINGLNLGGSLFLNPVYSGTDFQLQTVNNATTTTALTPAIASPTYGQVESFTAVVTAVGVGLPTPTGTVSFLVDGVPLGTTVTLSPSGGSGSATSISTSTIPAGSHTITANYSGDGNYAATSTTAGLTVSRAHLAVVPDNLSRPAGQANPPLTYSLVGFVNNENPGSAGVTGTADLATTADMNSPAGSYPITVTDAGTLAAPNYDFPSASFGTGTLTVQQSKPPSLKDWQYFLPLTDVNGTSLTNFVTKVALTSSNFDFALAKPDGSDLRVYDATTVSFLPIWLPDYNSVARTATVYYRATNTSDATYLYYGNTAAAAVSNFSAVFPHGTDFTSGWGDLSTATAGATAATATYPAAASPSDPRNLAVWTQAESPTLSISDLTAAGIPQGNYTGIREFSLVRDANDRVLQINGKYYAFFARRPSVTTDPIDTWRCESTSPTGPWTNFTKVYTPPSPIRLGYAGCTIQIGSTYYLFLTYGWTLGGGATPGITVYVMTSQDLTNWSPVSKSLDPGIFNDQTSGPVTDIGNPWVIRCADGTYMMTVEGHGSGGLWACYGATSTDLVSWTALNSGNPLVPHGTGSQWDFNAAANPKCLQMPDGSYVIQYAGADDPTNGDLADRLRHGPVAGRPVHQAGRQPRGRPTRRVVRLGAVPLLI